MKHSPRKSPRPGRSHEPKLPVSEDVPCDISNISLLIVDDHAVVRGGLEAMLSVIPGIDRITTAKDGEEAINLCATLQPDVILMDLRMPDMDGHSAMESIARSWPQIRVIVFTGNDTAAELKLAKRHGAAGFLSKSADPATLLRAIGKVAAGGTSFPEQLESQYPNGCNLSGRELEVLRHLVRGLTNDEMGRALFVSGQTIKGHLKHIFPKLGASTRAEAVNRAHELGLV